MKSGYSYIRFSTRDQLDGNSLVRQIEATDLWCQRNGVTLDRTKTLNDLGVSARLGQHRDNPDKYALAAFVAAVEWKRGTSNPTATS